MTKFRTAANLVKLFHLDDTVEVLNEGDKAYDLETVLLCPLFSKYLAVVSSFIETLSSIA